MKINQAFPEFVRIVEVGARDGLQNQSNPVPTQVKVELIEKLCDAGIKHIEAGAFVSPKWVPLMADSAEVLQGIKRKSDVIYSTLTPNLKGMESAITAKVNEVAVFIAASESFSQKNTNCSIEEAIQRAIPVIEQAQAHNIQVRAYISCVMACPYEGDNIDPQRVADLTQRLVELGCYEVSLGDTIGRGTPLKTQLLIDACAKRVGIEKLAVHFHNTYGQALANIYAALCLGVAAIDSSVAGLGGCPYAKGASGNVATEDVLYMLNGLNIRSDIDIDKVVDAANFISKAIGVPIDSNASRAITNARI